MGTNFYRTFKNPEKEDLHIGKRSGSSWICCNVFQDSHVKFCEYCKQPMKVRLTWLWAVEPHRFYKMENKNFKNEYDEKLTHDEMVKIIEECSAHKLQAIGKEFS